MTNEIKEKIEYLKKFAGIYEGTMITEIEDYITNLQEEIKEADEAVEYWQEQYGNLQQRIDRASNLCEPFVEWGECTINGKMLKQILDILRGDE